jgi:exopolysaccharide biosynthesis polyprenyl glycosylphosphotransferase
MKTALVDPPRTTEEDFAETRDRITAALDDRTLEIIERRRTSRFKRRGWLIRRLLLLADVVGLTSAYVLSLLMIGDTLASELALFAALLPVWVVLAKLNGLYDRDEERADYSTTDDLAGVFVLVTLLSWLYVVATVALGLPVPNIVGLTIFWGSAVPLITLARICARGIARRHPVYVQNTLIVGAGDVGQTVARKLLKHPEYGVNVAGFVDTEPRERCDGLEQLTLLGSLEELREMIRSCDIERVIIAFSNESDERVARLVRSLDDLSVQVDVVPRLFDVVGSAFDVHSVEGLPLIGLRPPRLSNSSVFLKRLIDVTIALVALVLLAPLLAVVALAIKVDSRGPVFFRQWRMGANGKTFRIFKFRTMVFDADVRKRDVLDINQHAGPGGDPRMFKAPNDPRVTRVGAILRRFSLDELPQLFNVLVDDMSLVGPRPLILEEDRHVQDWARRRLDLKPGITGPWQVLGRSEIPFGEMVALDYMYVTRWSLSEDVKLLLRTIPAALRRRNAY